MPTYDYSCANCKKEYSIVKNITSYNGLDECPDCKTIGQRIFSSVTFIGEGVQSAEYNPAFGKVVKNKHHRSELAKQMNLVEIGNDFKSPELIHSKLETDRQERLSQAWKRV